MNHRRHDIFAVLIRIMISLGVKSDFIRYTDLSRNGIGSVVQEVYHAAVCGTDHDSSRHAGSVLPGISTHVPAGAFFVANRAQPVQSDLGHADATNCTISSQEGLFQGFQPQALTAWRGYLCNPLLLHIATET